MVSGGKGIQNQIKIWKLRVVKGDISATLQLDNSTTQVRNVIPEHPSIPLFFWRYEVSGWRGNGVRRSRPTYRGPHASGATNESEHGWGDPRQDPLRRTSSLCTIP